MVVVLSSHAVSTDLNYIHIMKGLILLSSITEGKCTELKNTIMHYGGQTCPLKIAYDDVSNCVGLLIWKLVARLKSATFLGN
jgi:hypothetical protein